MASAFRVRARAGAPTCLRARASVVASALCVALVAVAHAQTGFDRSTPRRTMRGMLHAVAAGDEVEAGAALEVRGETPARAGALARQLSRVVERALWLDVDSISDERATAPGERVELGELPLGDTSVPLTLVAVSRPDDGLVWVVSASVVTRIPALYAEHGPSGLERALPSWMSGHDMGGGLELWQLVGIVLALLVALVAGRVLSWLLLRVGARLTERTKPAWDDALVTALRGPTRFVIAVAAARALLELLQLPARAQGLLDRILVITLIAALAWAANRLASLAGLVLENRAAHGDPEASQAELRSRGLRTQVLVLRRVFAIVVWVVAIALMLVQFDLVRTVGLSLLASAGMAGIVIGLAAQRSIATLLAGIQLSITQPIRLGDTVIVEDEWGKIEEINLTYVVVKIWDERRLVVPMTRFLDNPFQNWTKVSSELLGTVFFHADYGLPVEVARTELDRILEGHPQWDGRVKGLVVTDARDRTLELRVLVSAKNADDQWNLRCDVREKMVRWLASYDGGAHLPRARLEGPSAARAALDE